MQHIVLLNFIYDSYNVCGVRKYDKNADPRLLSKKERIIMRHPHPRVVQYFYFVFYDGM